MKNDKLKNYALGLMLLLVLGAISAVAQTGRRQERQLEPQQQQGALQTPDQRRMPQRQVQPERHAQQDRWDDRFDRRDDRFDRRDDRFDRRDDRNEGRFDRLADKLERARERQELQHIRQLDRQRQLRYQYRSDNRIVGYFDRFGQFHAVGYYDRFGNFWRYR